MNLDKITLELYEEALTASLNRGSEHMRASQLIEFLSENLADLLEAKGETGASKKKFREALQDVLRDKSEGEDAVGVDFLKSSQAAVKALRFRLSMTMTLTKLPLEELRKDMNRAEFSRGNDTE